MRAAFLALHPECTDAKVELTNIVETNYSTRYDMKVVAVPPPFASITLNIKVDPMERDVDPSYECHPEKVPNSIIGQCHAHTRPVKVGG